MALPTPTTSDKIDLNVLREYLDNLDLSNDDNLNFWLYCMISMRTGLRSIDILEMKVKCINFTDRKFHLIEKKTKKEVDAPLSNIILEKIDRNSEFVIFNKKYKTNVSLMTINRRLKKIYEGSGQNVSSHSIRKSVASQIYSATNNDIVKAMVFLNHSSPNMTKNYLCIDKETKYNLYNLLD